MPDELILRILLSFFIGGVWITIATLISEKLGTTLGGIITSLPSTSLLSLLFIGLKQDPVKASEAATVLPIGIFVDNIFLLVFIICAPKYKEWAIPIGYFIWFILAAIFGITKFTDMYVGTIAFVISFPIILFILNRFANIKKINQITKTRSFNEYVLRAVLAGSVISGAVLIANTGGPIWGGMFSIFPAVISSTLLILCRSQKIEFVQTIAKVMFFSSICLVVYGWGVHFFYPTFGLLKGTIFSYVAAAFSIALTYPVLVRLKT